MVLSIRVQIEAVSKSVSNNYQYIIHNDAKIACVGALNNQDGIVMIA